MSKPRKLSDVMRGTRAITVVKLPLCNTPGRLLADQPELEAQRDRDGHPDRLEIDVGIRALTPGEFALVLERALTMAKARGVDEKHCDALNPIYSFAYNVNLIAIACVCADSDPADPEPFFGKKGDHESAVQEILSSEHLTRDSIAYLAEHQEAWQDAVAPQATKISAEGLWELVGSLVQGDTRAFLELRPGMQLKLALFMAHQLLSSLMPSSQSGSDSGPNQPQTTNLSS